jgi:NitT/TauT family transport system substrate-binding protein
LGTLAGGILGGILGGVVPGIPPVTEARAVELNVTQYGVGMYGLPFAIAKEKGFFKEAGIDVTGFLTSSGGGTTIRNTLASDMPYGEVSLPAALAAIKEGLPIVLVHGGVRSAADQIWVTRKDDERIKSPADLAGKRLGYSGPAGVTDILSAMLVDAVHLTGKVERKPVGSVGAGLTVMRAEGVDATYIFEPALETQRAGVRVAFTIADTLPNAMQTVGIVSHEFARQKPDMVRGLIEARRKGVAFIAEHPDQAAQIMAKEYRITQEQAKAAIDYVTKAPGGYWSDGSFDYDGMNVIWRGMRLVGTAQTESFDWSKVVDESFLPVTLRKAAAQ